MINCRELIFKTRKNKLLLRFYKEKIIKNEVNATKLEKSCKK